MSKWSSAFRDSRWQKMRLKILERDNWACIACGKSEGITLNVHHAFYETGKAPWEYEEAVLYSMCSDCHTKHHALQKELSTAILDAMYMVGNDNPNLLEFLLGVADCLCGPKVASRASSSYHVGYDMTEGWEKARRSEGGAE